MPIDTLMKEEIEAITSSSSGTSAPAPSTLLVLIMVGVLFVASMSIVVEDCFAATQLGHLLVYSKVTSIVQLLSHAFNI
jgi:hypothetical protein